VTYDTLTSSAKPSINRQLSYCTWSFTIVDESHWYKTKNSVCWELAMNVKIEFTLQVTATPEFHSLYDWCYQTMWLFSSEPDDQEDDTVMEKDGAEALYSAVKSLMNAIQTKDKETQQDAAHRMIQIAKLWTIRRWSESKLANGNHLFRYCRRMPTSFISSGLRKSKHNYRPLWRDTPNRVLQEHGGFSDGG